MWCWLFSWKLWLFIVILVIVLLWLISAFSSYFWPNLVTNNVTYPPTVKKRKKRSTVVQDKSQRSNKTKEENKENRDYDSDEYSEDVETDDIVYHSYSHNSPYSHDQVSPVIAQRITSNHSDRQCKETA